MGVVINSAGECVTLFAISHNAQFAAGEHVKPVPVSEFSSHVERLHADRDKLFEMEYEVRWNSQTRN